MPRVGVSLRKGKPDDYKRAIGDAVYDVPKKDWSFGNGIAQYA